MRGAIPPLPNTHSWRGAQLKHRDSFTFTFTDEWMKNGILKWGSLESACMIYDNVTWLRTSNCCNVNCHWPFISLLLWVTAFNRFTCTALPYPVIWTGSIVTMDWHVLRLQPPGRRIVANISNKQSQTAEMGQSSILGIEFEANNSSP